MEIEEFIALSEKVKSETSTPEEELQFLQAMNNNVDTLLDAIKEFKENDRIDQLRQQIQEDNQ